MFVELSQNFVPSGLKPIFLYKTQTAMVWRQQKNMSVDNIT